MVIEIEPGVMLPIDEKYIDGCKDEFFDHLREIQFTNEISEGVINSTFRHWFEDYKLKDMQREDLKADAVKQLEQNRDVTKESETRYKQLVKIIKEM